MISFTSLSANSQLKWPTAARQPRGLACMVPWEGMGDYYREGGRHGGMYHNGVCEFRDSHLRR